VDRSQNQAVREWAKTMGIDVSDRGRIPGHVIEQERCCGAAVTGIGRPRRRRCRHSMAAAVAIARL